MSEYIKIIKLNKLKLLLLFIAVIVWKPQNVVAKEIIVDRIAASVQGTGVITTLQLIRYSAINAVIKTGYKKGTEELKNDQFIKASLNKLIDRILILKDAELLSIKPTDPQKIRGMIRRFKAKFESNRDYDDFAGQYDITENYLRKYMSEELTVKRYIYEEIRILVKVSNKDIQTYYMNNKEAYKGMKRRDANKKIKEMLEQKERKKQMKSWIKSLRLHREIIILY